MGEIVIYKYETPKVSDEHQGLTSIRRTPTIIECVHGVSAAEQSAREEREGENGVDFQPPGCFYAIQNIDEAESQPYEPKHDLLFDNIRNDDPYAMLDWLGELEGCEHETFKKKAEWRLIRPTGNYSRRLKREKVKEIKAELKEKKLHGKRDRRRERHRYIQKCAEARVLNTFSPASKGKMPTQ